MSFADGFTQGFGVIDRHFAAEDEKNFKNQQLGLEAQRMAQTKAYQDATLGLQQRSEDRLDAQAAQTKKESDTRIAGLQQEQDWKKRVGYALEEAQARASLAHTRALTAAAAAEARDRNLAFDQHNFSLTITKAQMGDLGAIADLGDKFKLPIDQYVTPQFQEARGRLAGALKQGGIPMMTYLSSPQAQQDFVEAITPESNRRVGKSMNGGTIVNTQPVAANLASGGNLVVQYRDLVKMPDGSTRTVISNETRPAMQYIEYLGKRDAMLNAISANPEFQDFLRARAGDPESRSRIEMQARREYRDTLDARTRAYQAVAKENPDIDPAKAAEKSMGGSEDDYVRKILAPSTNRPQMGNDLRGFIRDLGNLGYMGVSPSVANGMINFPLTFFRDVKEAYPKATVEDALRVAQYVSGKKYASGPVGREEYLKDIKAWANPQKLTN